jgi:predicted RNA-binding protein YlqC (UPF0109 family)
MNQLTKPAYQERSKINIESAEHAKAWTHTLGVTEDELRCVIDKVGNSAAAVRKEIDNLRQHARYLCESQNDEARQ